MAKAVGVRVPPFAEREPSVKEEKALSTIREINVVVPKEEIDRKKEEIIKNFKNRAKIRGFRPGNAPLEIVERVFKEEIEERLVNEIIYEHGSRAIEESGFSPLGSPSVKNWSYGEDGSLSFSIVFEVIPPYDVVDYKGLEIELVRKKVEDKDVENAIQNILERFSQLIPVEERGVQEGDIVEVEVQRFIVPEKRALPVERYRWQIYKEIEEVPGLYENIIGMKSGEEKRFKILYPEEFERKNLRGKEIETRVKVVSIKIKKTPQLTDELLSQIGEYKSVEELKEKIREKLSEEFEKREREILEGEVLRILREKNPVNVPIALEKMELQRLLNSIEVREDLSKEEMERLIFALSKIANQNAMNYLILTKIGEKEGIKVDKKEVESELRRTYDLSNLSIEEIERLKNDIEKKLSLKKTLDFVISKAIIKYKEEK